MSSLAAATWADWGLVLFRELQVCKVIVMTPELTVGYNKTPEK